MPKSNLLLHDLHAVLPVLGVNSLFICVQLVNLPLFCMSDERQTWNALGSLLRVQDDEASMQADQHSILRPVIFISTGALCMIAFECLA